MRGVRHTCPPQRREEAAAHEIWPDWKGDRVDCWWAFASSDDGVYYYNFRTGEKRAGSSPPEIGLQNSIVAQRGIRGFIARKRVRKLRLSEVIAMAKARVPTDGTPTQGLGGAQVSRGGKVFNVRRQTDVMEAEETIWKLEKEQRRVMAELSRLLQVRVGLRFLNAGLWCRPKRLP